MRLIRGAASIERAHKDCVATVGSFDGIHRGHQKILGKLTQLARACSRPSCVVVFEPLPGEFFSRKAAPARLQTAPARLQTAPARLQTLEEKLDCLKPLGIDQVLCLPFNHHLRALTADHFIQEILVEGLAVRHLLVGDDFRFGCDRKGCLESLQAAGAEHGFAVEKTPTCMLAGERISSTRIRQLLARGDFATAARLLGRPFTMSGRVQPGRKLGRELGVPTANLATQRQCSPIRGVCAVRVRIEGQQDWHNGVANLGCRPTVDGTDEVLEVHLLDFEGDLYGRRLEVSFVQRLRDEKKFDGIAALKAAIAVDIAHARQRLSPASALELP